MEAMTVFVVLFAVLLGFAGFIWFLYADDRRMQREQREDEERLLEMRLGPGGAGRLRRVIRGPAESLRRVK